MFQILIRWDAEQEVLSIVYLIGKSVWDYFFPMCTENETYNAELIGITYDVIEMKVKKPPETYEDAMKLAKEQMAYCDDIVFQGTMTVRRLAQVLVSRTTWLFWINYQCESGGVQK